MSRIVSFLRDRETGNGRQRLSKQHYLLNHARRLQMDFQTLLTEYEQLTNQLQGAMYLCFDDERVEYWVSELKRRLGECKEWINSFGLTKAAEESWRVASEQDKWDNYGYFKNIQESLEHADELLGKSWDFWENEPARIFELMQCVKRLTADLAIWTNYEQMLVRKNFGLS